MAAALASSGHVLAPSGGSSLRRGPAPVQHSLSASLRSGPRTCLSSAGVPWRGGELPPRGGARPVRSTAGSGGSSGGGASGSGGGGGGGGDEGYPKHPMQLWTFIFSAALAAGGTMAYVKRKSAKSLGAGLSTAFVLALCGRAMGGPGAVGAARVAFALCFLLGVVMGSRYNESRKFFPAGAVSLSSLGMAVGFAASGL